MIRTYIFDADVAPARITETGSGSGLGAETRPFEDIAFDAAYQQILDSGNVLPMHCHPDWNRMFEPAGSRFVVLVDPAGGPAFAFSVERSRSRALPGQWLLRVRHFGDIRSGVLAAAGLAAVAHLASCQKHLLRVYLEVFCPFADVRSSIARSAQEHGFRRSQPQSTGYESTLALKLDKSEEELFLSFSRSARRNIRAPAKKGLLIRPITDENHAERMSSLLAETLRRTGGSKQDKDWAKIIAFSRLHPDLSRVVGCFSTSATMPSDLLSFAWGCRHCDHATHTAAASTRTPGCNMPLSYATTWDLIQWAKHHGATWFDFGGVTSCKPDTDDSLEGISDFKRFFTTQTIQVGEEWTFEPSHLKGQLARLIGKTAGWAHRWVNRSSSGYRSPQDVQNVAPASLQG